MTRFRLRSGPLAIFGAVFVLALIALLPMRLALSWFDLARTGIAARDVGGSVWSGSLREAEVGEVPLGDLGAALSPWPLFVGRARVDLAGHSTTSMRSVHGAVTVSRHGTGIDDMTASLLTGDVFAPLPVTGLDLDDVSVRFEEGACRTAQGRVKAILGSDVAGIGLGQSMAGTARCDAGALLLPFASQSGTESVVLRLWQTGRYRAELIVRPSDPAVVQKLVLAGFQPTIRGYLLAIEGRF